MKKGYNLLTLVAGLMLIAGFVLPWLEKSPFHYSGASLAMLGYGYLLILPIAGAAAVFLTLTRSQHRAAHLLYPGLAGLTVITILIASLIFSDTGALSIDWNGPWTEMVNLTDGERLLQLHPVSGLGFGLIWCLTGTLMLCVLPLVFRSFLDQAGLDQPQAFRNIIKPTTVLTDYRRFLFLGFCLVILAVTWVWCGISPAKVWENRGNAREYLFGRALNQADLDYIQDQKERAPQIDAMGRAREYMSNKYRDMPYDRQPDPQAKVKERLEKQKEILASMNEKEIQALMRTAEKDAL